ncbi:ABC transporter substrate-binding protein [Lutimaribacter sp. EGI FJ00015]|uniref:ABC transporter substrate-binding protein n=1 Tax=Lutimaribacter degradans TaxID=2945989 RepID=A0ACC5ZYR4_9RHOB|nr:ABC transporter substrate-binding protein [Lutimaribacter sp. EGI FJ00013]MCM2563320.1 ABC transporter substrate-binding protein [Lutimaribacter sp. EGI FJ00013]MCO0614603.1 ABC transporter substrate-binding protein [Lutimaribacter sp. EGI FJ00015]MCO0637274.1 ABC transporter substrate-binding protein [Lutimaribacter sp. EGI FJ00014]
MKQTGLSRRGFLGTTAALGALGLTPGWTTAAFAQTGGTLRLRIDGDNDVLDPGFMTGGTEIEAQKQCLPFLAQYARDGETFTWEPSYFVTKLEQRDATHIDFELAEGLVWSNGYGPVLASDVKFSYERMKDSDWSGYFEALDHVEVTGDRTGTIVLGKPFAPFIMITLCHGPGAVLSEKAMADVGDRFTTQFPAVCGPYTYEATPGQRAVFTANPEWTGPKPAFDRVECNVITEVKAAELAFEAGELDCTEVGADTLARYTKNMPDGTAIAVAGELQYMWMGMNTEHPKLQDIRVRKAIQHAVDVDTILQGAYSGTTAKSHGIICPGLTGQRDSAGYGYDPAKARDLLAEAGVSGLQLTLRTLNNQERMLAAQIIQANLMQVGITVKVLPLDSGPFWEMGQESKGDTWQDLELWLMRFGTTPDPYEATQWFTSDQVGVWNWERWTDEEYDRLYEEGINETDPQKRHDIYVRMQEIMENTGAYVWINHEPEAFVHSTEIGVNAAPSGELNYRRFTKA